MGAISLLQGGDAYMSAKAVDIFEGLNEEQRMAANAIYGPILTSAPAGARQGKQKLLLLERSI